MGRDSLSPLRYTHQQTNSNNITVSAVKTMMKSTLDNNTHSGEFGFVEKADE